jgi:hypothetical protein
MKILFKEGQRIQTQHEPATLRRFAHKVPGRRGQEVWHVEYEQTHTFGIEVVQKSKIIKNNT